jgi:hypothetical protein
MAHVKRDKSNRGALTKSAIASAKRLVFPVRETYKTQAFISHYSNHSLNSSFCLILQRNQRDKKKVPYHEGIEDK